MFILGADRRDPMGSWWTAYQSYLQEHQDDFPTSAYELATSDWFHAAGPQAPHDGWLQTARIQEREPGNTEQHSKTSIEIDLLGAFHDGQITLRYEDVRNYKLDGLGVDRGLGDWRYDEFTLVETGVFKHEIEWWSHEATNTWVIEAANITHSWRPFH